MTSIWIDHRHMKIRSFGSSTKGTRGVVKIEIEVSDPSAMGYLLKELGEANGEIARARAASAEQARTEKEAAKQAEADEVFAIQQALAKPRMIDQQKLLGLPYFGGEK
jgi:hypothetical protein